MSLVRHSALNIGGAVIPMLVAIPSIGMLARVLDTEEFSSVTLAWALVGYAGILELGVSRAVTRLVADSRDRVEEHTEILSSAAVLVAVVSAVAGTLVFLTAAPLAEYVLRVSERSHDDVVLGLRLVAVSLPPLLMALVLQSYWDGIENFVEANLQRAIGGSLVPASTAIAAVLLPTFSGAMIGLLLARVAVVAGLLMRGHLIEKLEIHSARWTRVRSLLGFGGWLTVSNAISPLMGYLDRYILAYTRGAALVAYYAAPAEAALRLLLLPVAVTRSLFPKLVSASSEEQRERLRRQALYVIAWTCLPIALVVALAAQPILSLWLGNDYASHSVVVLQVLMLGFVACAFAQIPFTQLHAIGRPDIGAKIHAAEAIPFILAAFWMTTSFGPLGAAMTWTIRNIVDLLALQLAVVWRR